MYVERLLYNNVVLFLAAMIALSATGIPAFAQQQGSVPYSGADQPYQPQASAPLDNSTRENTNNNPGSAFPPYRRMDNQNYNAEDGGDSVQEDDFQSNQTGTPPSQWRDGVYQGPGAGVSPPQDMSPEWFEVEDDENTDQDSENNTSQSQVPSVQQNEQETLPERTKPDAKDVTLKGMGKALYDGQSLIVQGHLVRIDSIHAPRRDALCHSGKVYSWKCGQKSWQTLNSILSSMPVRCHGRIWVGDALVAQCIRGDGSDIASLMVREGMAIVNRDYFNDYLEEETVARSNNKGLWSGTFDLPWE